MLERRQLFTLYFVTFVTVCHAELNAIMNKNSADVHDCTIYVALFPCNECAKLIIQSGIREVRWILLYIQFYIKKEFVVAFRFLWDRLSECLKWMGTINLTQAS